MPTKPETITELVVEDTTTMVPTLDLEKLIVTTEDGITDVAITTDMATTDMTTTDMTTTTEQISNV